MFVLYTFLGPHLLVILQTNIFYIICSFLLLFSSCPSVCPSNEQKYIYFCSFCTDKRRAMIHFPDRMYHCFFSISESTSTSTPTQGSRLRLEFRAPERGDTTRDNQTRTLRYQCVGAVCSDSCIRRKEQRPAVCGWEPYVVIPALGGRREAGPRRSVGRSQ